MGDCRLLSLDPGRFYRQNERLLIKQYSGQNTGATVFTVPLLPVKLKVVEILKENNYVLAIIDIYLQVVPVVVLSRKCVVCM